MRQVVCLASRPWLAVPTRTQQLMARMKYTEILYFEPPRSRADGRWRESGRRLRPELIAYTLPPAPDDDRTPLFLLRRSRDRTLDFLHSKLRRHHFRDPVLWCTSPGGAEWLDELPRRGLVYDCYQEWSGFPDGWEEELCAQSDVVFAASPGLARRAALAGGNVKLLPYGCNYPMFARDALPRPQQLSGVSRPVLGYAGTVWPDLDLTPVLHTARAMPWCNVVLVGPKKDNSLLSQLLELPNVYSFGPVEPVDLPEWIAAFDACLLPRRRRGGDVLPPRVFEYLSAGKPIVAMLEREQVELFPDVVYSAHDSREFARLCGDALEERSPWAVRQRREYGKAAAWSERAREMEQTLEAIGLFSL